MDVAARYRCAGLSDAGRKRGNNEDCFHADPDRGIFFVIDGVGGQNAGEKAAATAAKLIRARLERQTGTVAERMREAITVANNEIYTLANSNPEWAGMACVLTAAVIADSEVVVGHVGDSRLYLVENGEIRKVTRDHSPVGEREDSGELDELTAMRHPRRNEVFRDVGSEPHSPDDPEFIDLISAPFNPSSALLLCSDGLSDLVPSTKSLAIVEAHADDPQAAARALVDAANEAGGKDNVTVVVVHGREFRASSIRRLTSQPLASAAVEPSQPGYARAILSLVLGVLITAALAWVLKPHWRDTGAGLVFGLGAVREPRVWRVQESIASALLQAHPGDTILVAPGTYREQIRLKDGVAVVSEHPREAILQTSGVAVTAEEVKSARIEGFRIIADEGQPLNVGLQVTNSLIQAFDLEISGAQTAGIEVVGNSAGTFLANHVSGNPGTGIVIRGEAKPRFINNTITNNGRGAGTPRPGVEVSGAAQPLLQGNVFANNAAETILAPHLNVENLMRQNFVILAEAPRVRPRFGPQVRPAR